MSKLKGKEKEQSVSSKYVRVTRTQLIWRQFKKNKGAMVGLITLIIIILLTIASEFLWDYNTDIAGMNSSQRLLPPSFEHPFGTDHAGRSLLARVIYGSRYSLVIGLVAVVISLGVGTTIGAIAGYYGGLIESIIMRIVEMLLFVPSMIITIILVATFGINLENLILAFDYTQCLTLREMQERLFSRYETMNMLRRLKRWLRAIFG